MINRVALLSDLQKLLQRLEADLLERSESADVPEVGKTLRAEYDRAKTAERTAQNYEDWRTDAITQAAAAWVLSCVFVRFLEDNRLIDPPKIAGPEERLERARDEHELYFREHPKLTDREYLLAVFDQLAKLPGTKDVFGEHNPIRELPNWLSGDAAGEMLRFFQKIDANTGTLNHDFTDPNWDTRFLGDLYQDLSEAARKKYALLQTPEFVEEFILDRTLNPALDEFGLDAAPVLDKDDKPITEAGFRMIDPACGSGHFLLGAFPRILDRWQRREPGTNVRELVQRALDSIHGVDVNPYAVAIARFRLLLAAMRACRVTRLADVPGFRLNLACGDSLLHSPLKTGHRVFDFELTSGDAECEHAYQSEDLPVLKRMLRGGQYHAVVANPPYITPKDQQLNERYRRRFSTCHMKYSLAMPFMEKIFHLTVRSDEDGKQGGYTGQITANNFMKREFGKKLIEVFFKTVDLTHILDVSGAYIPGHNGQKGGTSTAILFGRNRKPVAATVRTLMGIDGEPGTPDDPAHGLVWSAIVTQIDQPGTSSRFVSVLDSPRETFASHPWSLGGGGVAGLVDQLEETAFERVNDVADAVGYGTNIGEDDAFVSEERRYFDRMRASSGTRPMPAGEQIRDYVFQELPVALYPYSNAGHFDPPENANEHYWRLRTVLRNVLFHRKTHEQRGLDWRQYAIVVADKSNRRRALLYAFVATHNHFAFDRSGFLSTKSAPGVYLPASATDKQYLELLGVVASSVACFWLRNSTYLTGGSGDAWSMRGQFSATTLEKLPLPERRAHELSERMDSLVQRLARESPNAKLKQTVQGIALHDIVSQAESISRRIRCEMISIQEDLDWQNYLQFGLIDEELCYQEACIPIELGQRAFEIVLARKMAAGESQTTWFDRHTSTPITELPADWPDSYRQLVERRIALIESDPNIRLIEQPEYKRRWNTEPWESQLERALREWLLDRLESYFDFDGRMNDADRPTATLDIALVSVAKLADVARQDAEFLQVGELFRDDPAFDVQALVGELVAAECVPLLPVLRYKPSGLIKHGTWERTWDLQRQEDAIDARKKLPSTDPEHLT